jgi:mono/diheme cytochrome c family protein
MATYASKKRILLCSLLSLTLIGVGTGLYWLIRIHGFSARERPMAVEAFLARHLRRMAIPPGSKNLRNPLPPTPSNLAEAREHFADTCAICHANNGNGQTKLNSGLYPPAPDLRARMTQDLTDGEIFYIIKNGIRLTGMPGWGGDDEDNWKLVLFIRHLPELTPKEIELMNEINGLLHLHPIHRTITSRSAFPSSSRVPSRSICSRRIRIPLACRRRARWWRVLPA